MQTCSSCVLSHFLCIQVSWNRLTEGDGGSRRNLGYICSHWYSNISMHSFGPSLSHSCRGLFYVSVGPPHLPTLRTATTKLRMVTHGTVTETNVRTRSTHQRKRDHQVSENNNGVHNASILYLRTISSKISEKWGTPGVPDLRFRKKRDSTKVKPRGGGVLSYV